MWHRNTSLCVRQHFNRDTKHHGENLLNARKFPGKCSFIFFLYMVTFPEINQFQENFGEISLKFPENLHPCFNRAHFVVTQAYFPQGGPLRNIAVHMREQKNKEKGVFFSQECVKQGSCLCVWNAIFHEKGVILSKLTLNSSDSDLFMGSNLSKILV